METDGKAALEDKNSLAIFEHMQTKMAHISPLFLSLSH